MNSITEGMRNRKRIIDYAIKHNNNAKAARKYHVTRQFVSYWRKRYDGTIEFLRKKSTRPKSHPNQHTEEEFELIKHMYRYHKHKGLAHVYCKCTDEGYTRIYDSMCKQINKLNLNKVEEKKTKRKKKKKKQNKYTYPGQLVEIDIKYKRTAPYSPWQNGHVERSHREDGEMLYQKKRFSSEKEMVDEYFRKSA